MTVDLRELVAQLRELANDAVCCGNTQRGGYCCGSPVPAILTDEAKARDFGVAAFNALPALLDVLEDKDTVRVPKDEYECLRQLQFYARHANQENMVMRFLRDLDEIDKRNVKLAAHDRRKKNG